jgi:hypothetical protein
MAPARDLRPLQRLLPEEPALNSRALTWTVSAAAGAALAAFAGLIGRWSADPALGWILALLAAGLGSAAAFAAAAPDEDGSRAWAAGGAIAALAVPALLRFLGLALAEPSLLENPLGGRGRAVFVLGQAAAFLALAALAWTRAVRGRSGAAAAALAGAAASFLALRAIQASVLLAAAALAALAAAEFAERPWTRNAFAPLRARAFAAAGFVGLALAVFAPSVLSDVWLARLHAAYPGGGYLAYADDGTRTFAAYRFSTGAAILLRDGVPQSPDPASVRLAVRALIGQHAAPTLLLLVRPPEPGPALAAQADGATVTLESGSSAENAALKALGGSSDWMKMLTPASPGVKPTAALLFLPRPPGAGLGLLAGVRALRALKARLADGGVAAVLLPSGTASGAIDDVQRAAAVAFGEARIVDLPRATLVLASPDPIEAEPLLIFNRLRIETTSAEPGAFKTLTAGLRWRAVPPSK